MTAADLVKQFEGFRGEPYHDAAGILTIGYGTQLPLTEPEATALLEVRLRPTQALIQELVTMQLTVNQFDALTSFVYNVGETAFRDSTLLRKLNAGEYDAVPGEMLRWVHAGGRVLAGLVKRRHAEADLWAAA